MTVTLCLPESSELTESALLALSRANPGYRFERSAEGKLIVSPTGFFPSAGEGELFAQVLLWAKATQLGRAFPSTAGLRLPDTSIVSPDTTYVTNERLAAMTAEDRKPAYARIVPDVVFELVSPSDDVREVESKIECYMANRIGVAVMIDPAERCVSIWRPDGARRNHITPSVEVGPEMPGFVLDVTAILRAGTSA